MEKATIIKLPNKETRKYIDDTFEYEPDTGKLWRFFHQREFWREMVGINREGYSRVYIKRKDYLGHQICWYLYYGAWPTQEIDHINRIRHDNRIDNMRLATDAEQTANLTNQSRYGRCIWYKRRINRYEVCIRIGGIRNYIGVFKTVEEAIKARDNAENKA